MTALTVMFTDVQGSTALRDARGDAEADAVLAVHARIVRDALAEHGGREAQFLGDGFLIVFDDPVHALDCAIDVQRALQRHNLTEPRLALRVRIGMHHGEVAEHDGIPHGQVVHAAARVTAQAAGGQVLVSADVRAAVGDRGRSLADLGLFWLKGFPERWRLYEVPWDGSGHRHGRGPLLRATLTPLIERDDERAELRRAMDEALAGRGRLVMVTGEAGVGKSRLVIELTAEAARRGLRVLTGHCVEMSSSVPYQPYVEMIEQAAVDPLSPLALRDALGDAAPEIARIAPVLRRVFPDIPDPVDLPPELARRYLWNSLHAFIERGARVQPLLLVLEDLHWADTSTILFTGFLAPLLAHMPVMVAGTYRDVELEPGHLLARTVNALARRHALQRIRLQRLSPAGISVMVGALAEQEPPEELVRLIDSETEGNPFFVEEVFLHLRESGRLLDRSGHLNAGASLDEIDVPESVRLVIGERLERLSAGARAALTAAAVVGRVFDPEIAAAVGELDPGELAAGLGEAERARLVSAPGSGERMAFSHELIRQTLLADASTLQRQLLHSRAADALEARSADRIEAHAADLADHLVRAGPLADRNKLVRYLGMSARHEMEAAAFEDAVADLQKALGYLEDRDMRRASVLEQLALALRSVGRWDDALKAMDQALDLYVSGGDAASVGRLSWAMVYHLTWAARFEEAVAIARRALDVLGPSPGGNGARLLSAAGWATSLSGDHGAATGMFAEARAIAEAVHDERALADVLHMQTIHHMSFAEFCQGVEAGLRAGAVFETAGALWDLSSVLAFVIYQDGAVGGRERAAELTDKTAAIASRLGHLGSIFMLLADRARRELMRGDIAALSATGAEMVEVCERGGLPWLYVGHLYLGVAAHHRDDPATAEAELRTAIELEPAAAFAGQSASLLAGVYAYLGLRDRVLELFEGVQPVLPRPGRVNTLGAWNTLLGFTEALYLVGESATTAAQLPLISEALALEPDWLTFDCHLVRTRAAVAAAAAGRVDEADAHLEAAASTARAYGNEAEEAHLLYLKARILAARPDRGWEAVQAARAAADRFTALGMPGPAGAARDVVRPPA